VLLDLHLSDRHGLEVYRSIRAIDARIPVIFIATAKTADAAIETVKHGAFDYLHKPLDLAQAPARGHRRAEVARMRLPVRIADAAPHPETDGAMLGASPRMLDIYKAIGRVAAQDVTVLITGESGTGKELVARAILPAQLAVVGAVPWRSLRGDPGEPAGERAVRTRARSVHRRRPPADRQVRAVQRCTVLLDEIGDMPLALQAKNPAPAPGPDLSSGSAATRRSGPTSG